MTARTHETIRVGLRRIIRDQSVSVKARLEAIKLLMRVEGLMEEARHFAYTKNRPPVNQMSGANDNRLRELLELAEEKKAG